MKKYAIITDEITKSVMVGIGTDEAVYKSMGMTIMDVEQSYDGSWYLFGYVPTKPQEIKEEDVRQVRNDYLVTYVDPIQLVIRWNSLTSEDQQKYTEYRQYLLDYTDTPQWYEKNPDDYPTWLSKHYPIN